IMKKFRQLLIRLLQRLKSLSIKWFCRRPRMMDRLGLRSITFLYYIIAS
uniref:Uncharacterized protein n=1 Tax=Amphimedon queenslandica TaxID=400682 RepID=A0A1X7T989_AMPQE